MKNSTNQSIKPITTRRNDYGYLEVGGCDLTELVNKYSTPLYVIDEATLRAVCNDYKEAFKDYEKVNFMYASKALCTSAITKIVASEGFGFDVVSGGEIYTVYKAGVEMKKVLFNGNNKTVEELSLAMETGVGYISVDNFLELTMLNEIAKSYNKNVDVFLRVTPAIECHTHEYIKTGNLDSKFGFDLSQVDEAIELIKDEYANLNLRGLHAHIGSQIFETQVYHDEIDILITELVRIEKKHGIKLDEINIGGGLGVKYVDSDVPPSTYEIAEVITNSVKLSCEKHKVDYPTIYLEPGRSIISTSGVTLYTIGSQKQVPNGRKYVAVDGGMADNPRPSMYQAEYSAEIVNKPANKDLQKVTVCGRYCESGDVIIKNIELPNPEAGDVLCVYNTGAYNYSMASNYNRTQKPAMVLVNSGLSDIIVERESLDDLLEHDVIPSRLK